jgi:hypothetical protein
MYWPSNHADYLNDHMLVIGIEFRIYKLKSLLEIGRTYPRKKKMNSISNPAQVWPAWAAEWAAAFP